MAFVKVNDIYYLTVLLLIRLGSWLSWSWLRNMLVHSISWLAYRWPSVKGHRSCQGLLAAFGPELEREERARILRSSFRGFWRDTFAVLPLKQEVDKLDREVVFEEELLEAAMARGRGVILLESNSFGERLTAKQILNKRGFPIYQVHAENHLNGLRNEGVRISWLRESVLKQTFDRWERDFIAEIICIPEDNSLVFTRTLLRRLAERKIVCSAGDGRMGQRLVTLPFLGRERPFATGMFSLSLLSGAPILPLFFFLDKENRSRLVIGPEVVVTKGKIEIALASYVKQLEAYARKYPEQYRNWHF